MLRLDRELRGRIEQAARASYPLEACGLILGRRNGSCVEAARVVSARNLDRERARDRYELDPQDFLAADAEARGAGLDIVGVWHSHPDHPARPSATDLERAWEGWSYVIVSVAADGVRELRAWRLADGSFEEEPIAP
jgi:proteasome lid subunit RPN8/RPN11